MVAAACLIHSRNVFHQPKLLANQLSSLRVSKQTSLLVQMYLPYTASSDVQVNRAFEDFYEKFQDQVVSVAYFKKRWGHIIGEILAYV